MGIYYKFRVNDEVSFMQEGDVVKIPNTTVFLYFCGGTLWIYTGKQVGAEDYFI